MYTFLFYRKIGVYLGFINQFRRFSIKYLPRTVLSIKIRRSVKRHTSVHNISNQNNIKPKYNKYHMSSSYLLYTACFHQRQYVDIVVNMLKSFYDVNPNANIDFMVYTNTDYRAQIEAQMDGRPVKFFEKNFVKTMNQSRISKVDI